MDIQKLLFEEIRSRISNPAAWSKEISELLHLGRDAVYRRERGDVQLTVAELETLCRHYGISLDRYLLSDRQNVVFKHTSLNHQDSYNYTQYIGQLLLQLQHMVSCEQKEIIFCADDIPIFHFMEFADLTYFKLYSWNQAVLNLGISYEDFVYELKKQHLEPIFQKLHETYCRIPSREIWSKGTIGPILELLEYHYDIGSFRNQDSIGLLLEQLGHLKSNLKGWTKGQEKHEGVHFDLYLSPVDLGLSQMLCQFDGQQSVTVKLYTINSIATLDMRYVTETIDWIRGVLNKSSCLSKLSEKERIHFFNHLDGCIDGLGGRLNLPQA